MNTHSATCENRVKKCFKNCHQTWLPAGAWLAGLWGAVVFASTLGAVDLDTFRIGSWPRLTNEMVRGIAISGDRVFVAHGQNGFSIFEVRQETNLVWLSQYHAQGAAQRVVVSGNYAFVAMSEAGLHILDVTDPRAPKLAATFDTPGSAQDVVLTNGLAYVADGEGGLQILDVSAPAQPQRVGEYDTPGTALGVALRGDVAFVADGPAGLHAVNVENPAEPRLLASNPTNFAQRVVLNGNYAYVLGASCGVAIIDAAQPNTLPRVQFHYLYCGAYDRSSDAAIEGNFLYVANGLQGWHIADITEPANPKKVKEGSPKPCTAMAVSGSRVLLGGSGLHLAQATGTNLLFQDAITGEASTDYVFIEGQFAYLAALGAGLYVLDISQPAQPRLAGHSDAMYSARDVDVRSGLAYVTDLKGLQIVDVSNPRNPHLVGKCDTPGGASRVALYGDYAYVSDDREGLQIVNISDPHQPRIVGNYAKGTLARDVQVYAHYAYLTSSDIHVLDLTNPVAPKVVTGIDVRSPVALNISDGRLYIAEDSFRYFKIVDLQNPAAPRILGATSCYAHGVAGAGRYCYVADYSEGVYKYDVRDPATPRRVALFPSGSQPWDLSVDRNHVYLTTRDEGLKIFDGEKLANPQRKGGLSAAGWAQDVAVLDHYAYVADGTNGNVAIVNFQDAASPVQVGLLALTNPVRALSISGSTLGVAMGTNGVSFFNLYNPQQPEPAGSYSTSNAMDVVLSGTNAYIADYSRVLVLDISTPQSPRLLSSFAERADGVAVTGSLVFTYESLSRGETYLDVYDVSDPTKLIRLGGTRVGCEGSDIAVHGNFVCLAYNGDGMIIVDFSDLGAPQVIGRYQGDRSLNMLGLKPRFLPSVAVAGQYAYLSSPEGLAILDISYPSNPVRVGGNTSFSPVKVAVGEDYLVAAAGKNGLVVLNPFTPVPGSGMSFSMARQPGPALPSLQVAGVPGVAVELQRSTNLQSWQAWTNITLSTNAVSIQDPESPLYPRQYYRAIAP